MPKGLDLGYMDDILKLPKKDWDLYYKMMEKHQELAGKKKLSPEDEAKYNKIDKLYKAFAPEADAYKMEGVYGELYKKDKP